MGTGKKFKPSEYNFPFDMDETTHLIFNSRTGAFAQVPHDEHSKTLELMSDPDQFVQNYGSEEKIFRDATRGGFVVDAKVDERALVRFNSLRKRYSTEFFHMTIMPTLQCNMACPYCYETREPGNMNSDQQEGLIKWARRKIKVCRRMSVSWFGGEPLLAFDVIRNLSSNFMAECESRGTIYSASMTTNAYLLTRDIADELSDVGVTSLQVTLDGPPKEHNSRRRLRGTGKTDTFDKILSNITYIAENHEEIKLVIRVNLDRSSLPRIPELFDYIPDVVREHAEIYFREVYPPPQWWDENKPTKISSVKTGGCSIDTKPLLKIAHEQGFNLYLSKLRPSPGYCEADYFNNYVIDPKCNIHKCTVAFDEEHRLGFIDNQGQAIFDMDLFAKWMTPEIVREDLCTNCAMLPSCGGGCSFATLCTKDCPPKCDTWVNESSVVDYLKLFYWTLQVNGGLQETKKTI